MGETARFDELGLWSFRSVWFSRHGTLLATLEALVQASEAGYTASELENIVNVPVKAPLLKLVREVRLIGPECFGSLIRERQPGDTSRQDEFDGSSNRCGSATSDSLSSGFFSTARSRSKAVRASNTGRPSRSSTTTMRSAKRKIEASKSP